MAKSDFIDARWGDRYSRFVSGDEDGRCDARLRELWRAVCTLTGSSADPPWTENVHSPRALPALVRFKGEQDLIVWDAGLGTLFNALAFPLPYNQPSPVVEALLRRLTAVRLVVAGRTAAGAAQIARASALLAETPIDRAYQEVVDAEQQFEVFLLTELQERFALCHELAHFLKEIDPTSFSRFFDRVMVALRAASAQTDPATVLTVQQVESSSMTLWDRDLDPYAWYLSERRSMVQLGLSPRHDWRVEVGHVKLALRAPTEPHVEEILCDILAGLAISLAAHQKQTGWTAIMAAACSRLALTNLETLLGIDLWVAGRISSATSVGGPVSLRQRCLNVLLPQMLPGILDTYGGGSRLQVGDVHAVMHRVESVYEHRFATALARLDHIEPGSEDREQDEDKVLVRAGFLLLRPDVDHRAVNRTAGEHKFELGSVLTSESLTHRLVDSQFRQELEQSLARHHRGDWGDVPAEDCAHNDSGLDQEFTPPDEVVPGRRDILWSQYTVCGEAVSIITSSDRSRTEILLDREYS
jgi:hypothetical protein